MYLFTASEDLHCSSELCVDVSYYGLAGGHTHSSTDHTHCLQFTVREKNEMWSSTCMYISVCTFSCPLAGPHMFMHVRMYVCTYNVPEVMNGVYQFHEIIASFHCSIDTVEHLGVSEWPGSVVNHSHSRCCSAG